MDGKINPFEHPPVYEYAQILTKGDLMAIKYGYYLQYRNTPCFKFLTRLKYVIGVAIINDLLNYLYNGKKGNTFDEKRG